MMFNEDLKKRFIKERKEEVVLPHRYLECQFSKTSEMEIALNKDISSFTYYEIVEYYKLLNLTSVNVITVMNSQFSMYTDWCLQQNLVKDGQNHFLEVKLSDFLDCLNKGYVSKKIITKETLYKRIEQLPNARDAFVLLGLFEGLSGKESCELVKLRPEDVNGNNLSLCTGRTIKVSDKLIELIHACQEEQQYISLTGHRLRVFPLAYTGYVLKDYPNVKSDSAFQGGRRIYNIVRRSLEYFDEKNVMTANDIANSGKINMIKERSAALKMAFEEYIYSDYVQEIEEQFNCDIKKKAFILKYEDYLVS